MGRRQKGQHPVGLETRHIFLDTEVYRSFGHNLQAQPMQVLGRYVEDGVLVLHTTDVTLREVRRQIGDMEQELAIEVRKVARKLRSWNQRYRRTGDRLPVPQALEPPEDSAAYRDFEWTVRRQWNARVHTAADKPAGPVLDWYFERQAPFDTKGGKEFPDAFALFAIESWCAEALERVYVVSKDKAVVRAAQASEHLIPVEGIPGLLKLVASVEGHDIADAVRDAFDDPPIRAALLVGLAQGIDQMGGVYRGDRFLDGDVLELEVEDLRSVADVTTLRVDEEQVACVADARLAVSALIDYTDVSEAWWDREDERYYGAETGVAQIRDVVAAKIFVELERNGEDFGLGSVDFLSPDLEVSDGEDDEWPYK